jgi:hypothetical protein
MTRHRVALSLAPACSIFMPYWTCRKSSVEAMKQPGFALGAAVLVVNDVPRGEKMTVGICVSIALAAVGHA